jgi:CRISPR locus-related DNA-binding protein
MTVIMATVGFTPAKVQPVIDREDAKEELVLFFDKDRGENSGNAGRSKRAAQELAAQAEKIGMPCRFVETDAFDLVKCCTRIRQEIKKRAGKDIVLSISGGTRVLSSAALLASILEGVRVVHISEKDNAVQPLPLLKLDDRDTLNPAQKRVLVHIREHPGSSQRDVAHALKLTKGTVSHHVHRLKRQGLVEALVDADDARIERLRAVDSADLLLVD